MLWMEKERSRIREVQMEKLRVLISINRRDRVPNAQIRKLCGLTKGVNERIVGWFGHVERMEKDRIANKIYVG